jgi:hypothetical protein
MSKFNFTRTGFPVRVNRFYGKDNHAPLKLKDLVEQIEIGYNGFPRRDPSDAFVQSAVWIESGKPLTDAELDSLDIAEALEAVA